MRYQQLLNQVAHLDIVINRGIQGSTNPLLRIGLGSKKPLKEKAPQPCLRDESNIQDQT